MINFYNELLKKTKEEIGEIQSELKSLKNEIDMLKNDKKKYAQTIFVGGDDSDNKLGEKPNNINKFGPIISPPRKLFFDPSLILSYSIYSHSVEVRSNNSLIGIGNNSNCQISTSLPKTNINQFTEFSIKDSSGLPLIPLSVVCCQYSTLYMFTKSSGIGRQLVLSMSSGKETFLDIEDHEPVALFGGYYNAAAIGREGEIIFINPMLIRKSSDSPIKAYSLPNGEKASSVACIRFNVVVLSLSGRVFMSRLFEGIDHIAFSQVPELSGQEFVCVSGTSDFCFAVSKEGRVYGYGMNNCGQLGLGKETWEARKFTEVSSLSGYKIRAAYAGCWHSLFETQEGKILSCGENNHGQLLLASGPSEKVYLPTETVITNASFCVAGYYSSVVFIDGEPPPNTPNKRIQQYI